MSTGASEAQKQGMDQERVKLIVGFVLGAIVFAFCLYVAWVDERHRNMQILLCLFGGVLGWVVGIVITPQNAGEKQQFSDYGKGVAALVSGYTLAKLQSLLDSPMLGPITGDKE